MKKKTLLVALAVAGLAAAGAGYYYKVAVARVPEHAVTKTVVVPPGYTTAAIAALLADEGLIAAAGPFVWYCRLHRLDGKLQAGVYRLSSADGVAAIAATLAAGRTAVIKLTVPEGYDKKKTAAAVAAAGICSADDFLAAAARGDPRGRVPAKDLEGYLYPDTYEVPADADADAVVAMMVDQFFRVMGPGARARAAELGRSLHEVVTLASVVEREAMVPAEKPLVASVFYNRLARGMRLESCATVIYALGRQPERLTVEDLHVDSPYNTYTHAGLPPGPICSPGEGALDAALYPADADYLFFVSNGDGTHTFTRTLAEHLAAKAQKKKRKKVVPR